MEKQLENIEKSYDLAIELGRNGINQYDNLPKSITEHKYYYLFEKMKNDNNLSSSERKEIYDYLNPKKNMNFIDLGCCLNYIFKGYDKWESTYYGVDISKKTIDLLENYVRKYNLKVGYFYNTRMDHVNFSDNYFDIATCIGSLEYFEKEYIKSVLEEIHRIMKRDTKIILDIPNIGSKEFIITAEIEKYLGREDKFNLNVIEFENMLVKYFSITKKEVVGPMIQYFLINNCNS